MTGLFRAGMLAAAGVLAANAPWLLLFGSPPAVGAAWGWHASSMECEFAASVKKCTTHSNKLKASETCSPECADGTTPSGTITCPASACSGTASCAETTETDNTWWSKCAWTSNAVAACAQKYTAVGGDLCPTPAPTPAPTNDGVSGAFGGGRVSSLVGVCPVLAAGVAACWQ